MDKPFIVNFQKRGSKETGFISFGEISKEIPFEVRRFYWLYGSTENCGRGNHAHKETCQLIVCLSGEIKVELESIKGEKETYYLNSPDTGLYIPKLFWRNIELSAGSVFLVVASTLFDEADYIRDYNKFKSIKS